MMSLGSAIEEGPITFREVTDAEKDRLWNGLKKSLESAE